MLPPEHSRGHLLVRRKLARLTGLFALGSCAGTGLDHLHVAGGVLSYPRPLLLGHAAWVPLAFGLAGAGFAAIAAALRTPARPRPSRRALLRDAALFVAAYALTAFCRWPASFIALALTTAWVARGAVVRDPPWRFAHAFTVAALGVGAEALLAAAGAFAHHQRDFLGLPWWLPALYLWSSPLVAHVAELTLGGDDRPRD